jgi:N utilization substance protein B
VGLRHKAREYAMQMLFQWEMSPKDPQKLAEQFWKSAAAADTTEKFANQLFFGAVREGKEIDALIERHSDNWRFDRLSAIDRAILRMAIYELRAGTAPGRAVITEALELAKKFSGEDSAGFLNGVLAGVSKTLGKT